MSVLMIKSFAGRYNSRKGSIYIFCVLPVLLVVLKYSDNSLQNILA